MRDGIVFGAVVLALILVAPALAAESFSVDAVAIDSNILPGEAAIYEVEVLNLLERSDSYTVSSSDFGYIVVVDDRPDSVSGLDADTYVVEVTPRSFVTAGSHRVPLRVRSQETGETEDISVILGIRDPARGDSQYVASIALGVSLPEEVDPREDLTLSVSMRNRNGRVYDRNDPITVEISSPLFYRSYETQLGPVGQDGEKTSEIRLDLDAQEPPGEHPLTVRLKVQNETVSTQEASFEIISYTDVQRREDAEGALFKTTTTYRVSNEGNVAEDVRIPYPISPLQRPFLSASHNYAVEVVDGERAAVITVPLEPSEEAVVTVTENYRLLALLVLIAILSGIGYYLLRSPVVLGKEASLSGSAEEGVSQIRVRVLVKNRSAKTMRNLRVVDRINGMADIVKEEALGTVRPTKVVKKKGQGTLLRWDLDQLEPFEERIITYRATTQLKLVGDLSLPAAKVKYDVPSGRERTTHSNEVSVARGA